IKGNLAGDLVLAGPSVAPGTPALKSLTVTGSVLAGGSVVAPSVGTVLVKGDLAGDLAVAGPGPAAGKPALQSLTVNGSIPTGTAAILAGSIGALTEKGDLARAV